MSMFNKEMKRLAFGAAASVAMLVGAQSAFAGDMAPEAAPMIDAHIQAIASAPAGDLSAQYAPDARLEWVGGPLDGSYKGAELIEGAWRKFASGRGDMTADVKDVVVAKNSDGRTVIATIVFRGERAVPARLITTYRGEEITSEIWQIDPALLQ